jgi:predicted RNA binding protein YcfA (HicA-like mRNA interferase family)
MSGGLPALTGPELIRMLKHDGWVEDGKRTHGIAMKKLCTDGITRITLIPTRNESLPKGTLAKILSSQQTNIGSAGLRKLFKSK